MSAAAGRGALRFCLPVRVVDGDPESAPLAWVDCVWRAVPAPERPLNLSMPRDVTPRGGFGAAAAERFAPEGVRAAVGDAAEPRGGMPFGSGYEARRSRGEGFGGAPGGHPGGMGQGRR